MELLPVLVLPVGAPRAPACAPAPPTVASRMTALTQRLGAGASRPPMNVVEVIVVVIELHIPARDRVKEDALASELLGLGHVPARVSARARAAAGAGGAPCCRRASAARCCSSSG